MPSVLEERLLCICLSLLRRLPFGVSISRNSSCRIIKKVLPANVILTRLRVTIAAQVRTRLRLRPFASLSVAASGASDLAALWGRGVFAGWRLGFVN